MESMRLITIKVVLLGQTCVGKSSLVLRFVQGKFFPKTEGTIGAAFLTKTIDLDSSAQVKFEIWDTAGQERYHSLAPMYYRGAQAAIVVYDVSSRDSFEKSKLWVNELREKSTNGQVVILVGNKCDLGRVIESEAVAKYSSDNKLIHIETSAKDGTNVVELFKAIALNLPKEVIANQEGSSTSVGRIPTTRLASQKNPEQSTCPC